VTPGRCLLVAALVLGGCGGAPSSGATTSDAGSGAEGSAETGDDGASMPEGGAASGAVLCTTPGNVGDTGHGCNFLLSPNVLYPTAASNNDPPLPPVTTPTSYAPHGDADPCTRKDPSSANLFMTYTQTSGGNLSTDMATSTNGGASWAAVPTSIWAGSGGVVDPYTGPNATGGGSLGVINSETSNLAFREVPGGVVLFGLHELYWQANGGAADRYTRHLEIAEAYLPAGSPASAVRDALATTTDHASIQSYPGVTACPGPDCSFPGSPPVDLRSAASAGTALDDCVWLHEPALRWQESDGALYLVLQCQSATDNRMVVFGTTSPASDAAVDGGTGSPASWTWTYQGSFLPQADAATAAQAYGIAEPSSPYFTQGDVAEARDGSLLYLASLVHLVGSSESRDGVFVFHVASLSQPALTTAVTTTAGAAPYAGVVRMQLAINGGDDGVGPGSSTYDPALTAAGVLYAGRTFPALDAGDRGFETDLFSFPGVAP